MNITHLPILLSLALVAVFSHRARAQDVLPRPEQPFGGYIARKAQDSIKDFPKEVTAPKGAPNILLILTDDVGFGATSPFGGPIPTPTFDRLAQTDYATRSFTLRRCARRPVPLYSPDAIIIPRTRVSSWKAPPAFPATIR